MVVDCGTAYLFYQSGEIGGGYIQFVGIEANLSLLAEIAAGVSRAADSRGTLVPWESAARSTVVARPSDVRSQPLWSYVDIPYRRTSSSPYVVHPYLLWMSYLPFLEAHF